MASDLRELLQQTAPPPTRPLDSTGLVRRAHRQRRVGRLTSGLAGVAVLIGGVLVVPTLVADGDGLLISDRPEREVAGAEQLWGRSYVSVAVTEAGQARPLVPGTRIELTLDREPLVRGAGVDPDADGFATWQAGCNRNGSQLYLSDGRFEFSGFSETTTMLCDSDELEQDRWIDAFFRSGPDWHLEDARLRLTGGEITIVFEDPSSDPPTVNRQPLELGTDHVWEGTGAVEEAARTFLAEVLGWRTVMLVDQSGATFTEAPIKVFMVFENADGRPIELYLDPVNGSSDQWAVTQVSAGIEHPISTNEAPSLIWRPSNDSRLRHGAFEGATGTAYIRTPERGTVAVPLDEQAVAAAEVSLDGVIDFGEPFCHNIQTTLLLFENSEGVITSAVGGVWYGSETPPECPTG